MGSNLNPYDSSNPMDNVPPTQSSEMQPSEVKGFYMKPDSNSFMQQYWHFDSAETKRFMTTLCNTITNEIKHLSEKEKEASNKLKESEEGND